MTPKIKKTKKSDISNLLETRIKTLSNIDDVIKAIESNGKESIIDISLMRLDEFNRLLTLLDISGYDYKIYRSQDMIILRVKK
ncbi:MAG: hypothetical protein QW197_03515 [Candidatus Aenigmatarchaeota archaeon]